MEPLKREKAAKAALKSLLFKLFYSNERAIPIENG